VTIDRLACLEIHPTWAAKPARRMKLHPTLRLAFVQIVEDPEMIFVISDEPLPETLNAAVAAIMAWRSQNEAPG